VSDPALEQLLDAEFAEGSVFIGEVVIRKLDGGAFELVHRGAGVTPVGPAGVPPAEECRLEARMLQRLEVCAPVNALEIAKRDDTGNYRPLHTAPNMRHDWRIIVFSLSGAIEGINAIYPGRLSVWRAWKTGRLKTTSLRATLNCQSGMYRVAAKISDDQIDNLVGDFCSSNGRCLRTILWRRDQSGAPPSNKLPPQKFDPAFDQFRAGQEARPATAPTACIPLLCQEACNLLIAACRETVKLAGSVSAGGCPSAHE
jgi:4Fe-4S iron-sulfur cluster binding domain/DR2241 stabilising domain